MNRTEKVIQKLKEQVEINRKKRQHDIYRRMTTEQLKELACGNPDNKRIAEIFSSVDGLHLLE